MRENWSKTSFGLFSPNPPKKFGGRTKNFVENEKNQSSSKLLEMARKLVENYFWTLSPPQKNFGGRTTFFCQKLKNQSCSKLPEMMIILFKKECWIF